MAKRAAVKKTVRIIKKTPANGGNEALLKELQGLIKQLDAEGLAWLADQAKIHIYNMRVDEHNEAIVAEYNKASGKTASKTAGRKPTAGFSIRGTESGSSYYLHYGNDDIMFTKDEMIHLVKIINGEGTDLEIRERLYNWLDRERRDIFSLANMKDKFDSRLKDLAAVIKKNFRLKTK